MKKVLFLLFSFLTINSFADCPGMTVNLTLYNPSCNASCDGYGYASVSGGSGNYNYVYTDASFNAVSGQTFDSVYNLCAGNYYLIVQDITNACFDTTAFTMVNPTPVVATIITNQNVSCFGGNDGSITAVATGGTGNYTYSWNTGATTPTISGLTAGTYFVYVTDMNGCTTIVTGVVSQPQQLVASVNTSPASCGVCDGMATGTASGGVPPYAYQWSPGGQFTQTITSLCPGSYQFIVTDANGCVTGTTANVGTTSSITVTATSTSSACNPCDGTVAVVESGGVGPYTYDLTGMPQQTNGNFSGVCAGIYVATVTDSQGCNGFYSVTVNNNGIPGLNVVDSVTAETGTGSFDGSINLTVSGSTGPYSYLWSNGATTEDIYSLAGGNYSVTITDSNGDCVSYSYMVGTTPSYGYVTGYLYNDVNGNCVFDAGDVALVNYLVAVTDGSSTYYGYSNAQGLYTVWVPSGNYVVDPYTSTNLSSGCTTSYNISVTNGSTIAGNDFAYTIPPVYDVCVSMWNAGIVPGFNGVYNIYVWNSGSMPADGTVCMLLPSPLTYVNSLPAGATVNNDTVCINYTNLAPNSSFFFQVQFNAPVSLALGTPLVSWVNATVTNGTDINPACNYYVYTRIVTGSFDPNDKTVSPAGENATGDILVDEDEFTYLVRFQNTGTGPAVNIVITDTLSTLLDPLSFEMLNASHSYTVEFINGNIIKWKFENIMLPDSGSNEPGSHGHVQFRLKTENSPTVGQVIENTANIYFDFNEPVITNTAVNTYVAPNGTDEIFAEGNFRIYPNPAENVLYVQSENGNAAYTIYDVTGKVNLVRKSQETKSTLDISSLAPGVYFIQCLSGQEVNTIRFMKK